VTMQFRLGRQEDSHEFLRYLIEGMQDSDSGKLPKESKEREAYEKRIRASSVFGVFGGLMKTVVECLSCQHKSVTEERYYDFNIVCLADKGRSASGPTLCRKA
jgi:ubiquitin carboxyl-terminal hydrolase 36/42